MQIPERVTAHGEDAPVCRCGSTPEADGFVPCDAQGREISMSEVGSLYRCVCCGLIVDVATFNAEEQTMRTAGEAVDSAEVETAPPALRRRTPLTEMSQEHLEPGDPTLDHTRGLAMRLVEAVAPVMPGADLTLRDAKAAVDVVLRTLLDEVSNDADPFTGQPAPARSISASELRQLVRAVRTEPLVLSEVFLDHAQIEAWAAWVLVTVTGHEPVAPVFTTDRFGVYAGPAQELVLRGELVEAVVLTPGQVWFRKARPETAAPWPDADGEFKGVRVAVLATKQADVATVLAFTHSERWAVTAVRWLFTQRGDGVPPAKVTVRRKLWVQVTPDCRCTPPVKQAGHDDTACMSWTAPQDQAPWDSWFAREVRPYTAGSWAVTKLEVRDAR